MYNKSVRFIPRYEESTGKGVDNYEIELENVIDKLIVECDKKIGRALKRLEDEDAKAAIAISVTEVTQVMAALSLFLFNSLCFLLNNLNYSKLQNAEVSELSKLIKEKLKEVDKYGEIYLIELVRDLLFQDFFADDATKYVWLLSFC